MPTPAPPTRRTSLAAIGGAAVAAVAVAGPALAHTGGAAGGALDGALHPLLGLDHLLAIVAVGALAALAGARRLAWAVPVGFLAGMAAGGALGLAGVAVPGVEVLIAASVVVLGALVASGVRQVGPGLVALAVAMGAVHGHAHGAELPAGAVPVAYVAGFLVVTAALHLVGAGVGVGLRRLPTARAAVGGALAAAGALLVLAG